MSLFTEKTYIHWIKKFIHFHNRRHPRDMGADEVVKFLSYLAVQRNVAASTQNQALNAIVFLYKKVLGIDPGIFKGITWARKPQHIPVVLSTSEVKDQF